MKESILYFTENSINYLFDLQEKFCRNPRDVASFVYGITDEMNKVGLMMIKETLEYMDHLIRINPKRKELWYVEKISEKQLITSLGAVSFKKTLYTNKKTGEMKYLLDDVMGLLPHERMTEDAQAKMLEEAVQTSYKRAGDNTSVSAGVSKQTVKNKLHLLKFPTEQKAREKKVVDYLFIDADEDHVSLQFNNKKGDLCCGENGRKNNCHIAKLAYVYEGIEKETPSSKRHRLINPHYFSSESLSENNGKFWERVFDYIEDNYDIDHIKKIYLNGDGGQWIKGVNQYREGVVYVLDEFHLNKYVKKMTGHMKDSAEDVRCEIRNVIKTRSKSAFKELSDTLESYTVEANVINRIREGRDYILSNWDAAKVRLKKCDAIHGCSAEGHVSHVLSSRMSSRPMGWSQVGADKMASLRVYYYNRKDMLELVRYQRSELAKASGNEEMYLHHRKVMESFDFERGELGKYSDAINHHLSLQKRKQVYFSRQINIW